MIKSSKYMINIGPYDKAVKMLLPDNIEIMEEYGLPELPYYSVILMLPENFYEIKSILIKSLGINILKNRHIKSAEYPRVTDKELEIEEDIKPYWENEEIYKTDKFYPYEEYKKVHFQYKYGEGLLFLYLYPYKFNAVKQEIMYPNKMLIEIKTDKTPAKKMTKDSRKWRKKKCSKNMLRGKNVISEQ